MSIDTDDYWQTFTQWASCDREAACIVIKAVMALLIPSRCFPKNEQKPVEFLLSVQAVPVQNEAFQDLINRQISCFSGKLIPAQVQSNLHRNLGAMSAKTPQHPCWSVFAHWNWQTLKPHDVAEERLYVAVAA